MDDLHWTGAAVLLALALADRPTRGARRDHVVASLGSEPRPRVAAEAPRPVGRRSTGVQADERPERTDRSPRAPVRTAGPVGGDRWVTATATCGHCGREAGELEWNAARMGHPATLRPNGLGPAQLVDLARPMRCAHCRGPVFVEEPRPASVRPPAALAAWGGDIARRAG